jgi:hypothetical protein
MAAGLVLPSRDEINSAAGTLAATTPERPWCGVVGSHYRVSGGPVVSLTCDCAWLAPRLEAILAPVELGRTAIGVREVSVTISVGAEGDYDFRVDGRLVRVDVARANARRLALNIVLVEALRHLKVGAVLHGAAVGVSGRAALLAGGTGAGKSTLALGLAARGFEHLSDDFIPLSAVGRDVHAFPLAASVKAGSWPILAQDFPSVGTSRVFEFGERRVRYVDPHAGGEPPYGSRPAGLLVFPRFEATGAPLLRSLAPEAAFGELLTSGSEAAGSPPSLRPLGELVNRTPAFEMTYSSLDEAARQLDDLMRRAGAGA